VKKTATQVLWAGTALVLLAAGCRTTSVQQHRFAHYRPTPPSPTPIEIADAAARRAAAVAKLKTSEAKEPTKREQPKPEPRKTEPKKPDTPKPDEPKTGGPKTGEPKTGEATTNAANSEAPNPNEANGNTAQGLLRPGDRIRISLRSIDRPEDIDEKIDGRGAVTLSHINDVVIAGMTTAAAEEAIRKKYIDGQIYTKITVIVVPIDTDKYYVRGHVRQSGEFKLTKGMTLSQALTIAGFDPFGYRKGVELIRGAKKTTHNLDKIEAGKAPDPVIQARDKINVPQKPTFGVPWP